MKYIPEVGETCGMYNYKHGLFDIHVVATGKDGLLAELIGFSNTIKEIHLEYEDTTFYPPKKSIEERMLEDLTKCTGYALTEVAKQMVALGWVKP